MNFPKLKFNRNTKTSGLTMVETLVAISILTIAVIGPLGIIAQALHTSYYTRDQMTAYYLAQEPLEYVRNLRDNRGLAITASYNANQDDTIIYPWLQGIASTSPTTGEVQLNLSSFVGLPTTYSMTRGDSNGIYKFTQCTGGNPCDYLKVDSSGIYGSDSLDATNSIFRREIYFVAKNPDSQEIKMVVNVYWARESVNP